MTAGIVILVAFGEENVVLSTNPQITFFKILYRRYTNFSIETIKTNFLYEAKFGNRYTVEISKIGDLLNKMWLVVELPEIPMVYDYANNVNQKVKFKWTRKVAYAMIDYVEIEIGGQRISRQWGEWMNILDELNWNNFNGSLDEYIGNTPDLTTYEHLNKNFKSKTLYIPLFFWFANSSGASLPLLCLEYSTVRLNINFNDFQSCGIFSPSNYILIDKYYGNGIFTEPLVQYSNQGIAWAEFDSVDVAEYDNETMDITKYYLYYRKISDNEFITSSNFISDINTLISNNASGAPNLYSFIIFGLYSGSIFVPVKSNPAIPSSIYIQQTYNFIMPSNLVFKQMYLLCNYIYLDRDERKIFYQNKHDYLVEQVYYSNPKFTINLNDRMEIETINPCKYFVFMGQVKYFTNYNVNENFNYNLYPFSSDKISKYFTNKNIFFPNKNCVREAYYCLNSNPCIEATDMKFYSVLNPFLYFPMGKNRSGFGMSSFSLYPNSLQPSGSCNMSYFSSFEIKFSYNPIDINYNKFVFKCYTVNYNILKIANGVCAPIFNSGF